MKFLSQPACVRYLIARVPKFVKNLHAHLPRFIFADDYLKIEKALELVLMEFIS